MPRAKFNPPLTLAQHISLRTEEGLLEDESGGRYENVISVELMFEMSEYQLIGNARTERLTDFSLVFISALDEETTDGFYLTSNGEVCVIINSMTLPDTTICIPLARHD